MFLSLILGIFLKPTKKMSEQNNHIQYEKVIPIKFADWSVDVADSTLLVDPEVDKTVKSVYSQVVSRVYTNANKKRIMFTVAYGGDQDEVMQVHKPEVCYTAQGFTVTNNSLTKIPTNKGTIIANRILARQAERTEPVTYWITIGNSIALNGLSWRWQRIKYGLTGSLPDGLLFRVSSIGNEVDEEYTLQEQFIKDLLASLPPADVAKLAGSLQVN
jgi:EpsI family protein